MLKPGDWVIIANGQERIIGFIRDFSRLRNEVYIVQVSTYLDKRITAMKPALEVVESKKIMAVGLTLAKEDWDAMIDLPIIDKSIFTLVSPVILHERTKNVLMYPARKKILHWHQ